jgi:hypothetical protein
MEEGCQGYGRENNRDEGEITQLVGRKDPEQEPEMGPHNEPDRDVQVEYQVLSDLIDGN